MFVHITFERNDGIRISDIHRDRIPLLCARYWDIFLSHCCSSIIYMYTSEPFLVILCDTLFRRSKSIFTTFESAETYKFLYIKNASFSRKILLKLIHFKSRNSGVKWSRFKYFTLLATFAAKLTHLCTSNCSFSLQLRWVTPYWTTIV